MAILRNKDIVGMGEKEKLEKINYLKLELMKEKINLSKGGKMKVKEIKKTIARLMTFNRLNKGKSVENIKTNKK